MFTLNDKKALITGATGGIGEQIARSLHAQGATVMLAGRRLEKLEDLVKSLGDRAFCVQSDLSSTDDVEALVPTATEKMDGLDILVNNAGITRDGLLMRMKDEDWQDVLKVNLESAFRLCRAAIRPMMKNRHGRIINITSIVGVTGNPGQGNYCASKAGLIGFSKSLAAEIAARNITVNCIAPGFIESPMTDALPDAQKEALLKGIPMGRMGNAKEIAAAVAFLASDDAAYITGQTIHVNGGMAMV
jgi:3-oxoacyl-[acyl-carrier protein] reductase